jgi:cobyrinic acid a,c-diamide synthase
MDQSFGFYYQDAFDVLTECGAEIVPFSPLADDGLPDALDGVFLGGGFPEVFADDLATNRGMRAALQSHVRAQRPL